MYLHGYFHGITSISHNLYYVKYDLLVAPYVGQYRHA